jgi:hypothetical protein
MYSDAANAIGAGVKLGHDVSIVPLPDEARFWLTSDRFSFSDRDQNRGAQFALQLDYEIADELGNLREKLTLANIALWIAKPSRIWFENTVFLDNKQAPPFAYALRTDARLSLDTRDCKNELDATDFGTASRILDALCGIPQMGMLWSATQLLWRALTDPFWSTRYVVLWVVMEALYGPKRGKGITLTIAQRVSRFLGSDAADVDRLRKWAIDAYDTRSLLVHGSRVIRPDGTLRLTAEEQHEANHSTESVIRQSLTKILLSKQLTGHFDGGGRNHFLNNV